MTSRLFLIGLVLSAATFCPTDSTAGELFSLCDPCKPARCGKKSLGDRISVYGWLQAGYIGNEYGCTNEYSETGPNSPASRNLTPYSGNTYLLMTGQPSDLKVNQLWLGVAKRLDTKHGFDWGFQFDTFFGTDAKFGQCFGDQTFDFDWGTGDYYQSIPQLYAEVGYRDFKVRAGKFASTMVHEALPAPMTFFYSHAYICFNTPLTFTGVVGEYNIGKKLTVSAGWTAGSHDSFENRFGDNGFLGAATYRPTDNTSLTYNLFCGWYNGLNKRADAMDRFGRAFNTRDEAVQTLVFTWQINKRWFYLIEGLYQINDNDFTPGDYTTKSYGINQHLIYTINARWAVGLRGEWHRAHGTIFDIGAPGFSGGQGGDLYEITLGLNWNPNKWFNLRPELRYDWTDYDNGFKPFNNAREANQFSAGCAMTVKF